MKRNLLILISLLFVLSAGAQQIKQEVIASAGGFNVAGDNSISISWTLGETIVPTFTSQDGTLILTHGFQQKLIITTVEENIEAFVQIGIYPNPASEEIYIRFESPTDEEMSLFLLDSQGKLVKTDQIEVSVISKMVNLQGLPAGIYFLKLTKGRRINVYKVVKL